MSTQSTSTIASSGRHSRDSPAAPTWWLRYHRAWASRTSSCMWRRLRLLPMLASEELLDLLFVLPLVYTRCWRQQRRWRQLQQ